ncbi:hypothetical protein F5144DRAFT_577305 [Chaetomium tenue]|uniref:Uncharacterized protein n=1 Tax=Chaetomium tenue TaxID=1854479 RepID=A0ACB7P6K5_9PEZI|nr:hypothetical protein F5144DRAFT_577305 [Chaetomium globosum]
MQDRSQSLTMEPAATLTTEPKADTFHLFPCLPFELRARIWELTVEPRTVTVDVVYENAIANTAAPDDTLPEDGKKTNYVPHVVSYTPVPAALQACREARGLRLYQRALSEISPVGTAERDRYFVWLNPNIDMVSIEPDTRLETLKPVAPLIRRLTITRECTDSVFYYFESSTLAAFVNVREIRVICRDGRGAWFRTSHGHFWPCENVSFVDPDNKHLVIKLHPGKA